MITKGNGDKRKKLEVKEEKKWPVFLQNMGILTETDPVLLQYEKFFLRKLLPPSKDDFQT
jgi:hypothetical protein